MSRVDEVYSEPETLTPGATPTFPSIWIRGRRGHTGTVNVVCRNICTRLYTETLVSGSHYTNGGKYCRRCECYIITERMFCERCGMQLRASPAGRVYKEKVRAKKKLIALKGSS